MPDDQSKCSLLSGSTPKCKCNAPNEWHARLLCGAAKHSWKCLLQYHKAGVTAVAFSKAHLLASAARDGSVALWSVYDDA
jgi:WD40 repeat protein